MKKKVAAKKKPAVKKKIGYIEEQLYKAQDQLGIIIATYTSVELLNVVVDRMKIHIHGLTKQMEAELDYANNETDSYRLQKQDARKAAKELKSQIAVMTKHLALLEKAANEHESYFGD